MVAVADDANYLRALAHAATDFVHHGLLAARHRGGRRSMGGGRITLGGRAGRFLAGESYAWG